MQLRASRALYRALPLGIIAAFFMHAVFELGIPDRAYTERLWLEWLGNRVLETGAIPRILGVESVLGRGDAWLPHEWAFAAALAFCARHGLDALATLAMSFVATVPLLITYARLKRSGADASSIALALVGIAIALQTQLQMRAALFATAFFAIACALLAAQGRLRRWFPLVVLLCANIHASAVFLALMPTCVWIVAALRGDRSEHDRPLLAIASIAASLCTPFGWSLYAYAGALTGGNLHRYIAEWTPLYHDLGSIGTVYQLCIACFFVLRFTARMRPADLRPEEFVPTLCTAALGVYAVRFLPLGIVALAPLALRPALNRQGSRRTTAIILTFAIFVATMPFVSRIVRMQADTYVSLPGRPGIAVPQAWTAAARSGIPARERVFCTDFAECNRFLWMGASVVLDGRVDPFPPEAFELTKRVNAAKPGWQRELTHLGITTVVATKGATRLASAIARDPAWRRVLEDTDTVVYVARNSRFRPGNLSRNR